MTIAACYVCSEGVVLGADSTATFTRPSGEHPAHYNHTQKVFEIGESSSLALVTWGLGGLGKTSYRTLLANLGDEIKGSRPLSIVDTAWRWSALVWNEYASYFTELRTRVLELMGKGQGKSDDEEKELARLSQVSSAGFCLAGINVNRSPEAFEISITADQSCPQAPVPIPFGIPKFWGWSNIIDRVNYAMDGPLFHKIITSGKWNGTEDELAQLVVQGRLSVPGILPIREAVDWVHSSIYTTIKGFKFSGLDPVCGGPIEVGVITTDRKFRWVTHKPFDSAIAQ